jgi:hypothetical protein
VKPTVIPLSVIWVILSIGIFLIAICCPECHSIVCHIALKLKLRYVNLCCVQQQTKQNHLSLDKF